MTIAQEAVQQWAAQPALAFGVHLGDLCDGKAQATDLGTDGSYGLVQSALDKAQLPFHYLIGNHDLYNYGHKARAAQALRPRGGAAVPEDEVDRPPGAAFYSFRPAPGGRVLLLDSYCFSALSGDATAADAEAFIRARNPNTDNLNSPKGLSGLDSRFVKLGGALGSAQLRWMEQQLAAARAAGESVVVLSHIPLNPAQLSPECGGLCLAWDYEAALAVMRRRDEIEQSAELARQCDLRLDLPQPRVALGIALRGLASSAIDVSDGLLQDLGHLCDRSQVAAQIEDAAMPRADAVVAAGAAGEQALYSGGDDYELLFTAPSGARARLAALATRLNITLNRIGTITEGQGVQVLAADGRRRDFTKFGFDHFAHA